MVKERIWWMLGGSIITIVVFILAQQFVFGSTSAEQITKDEAENIVSSRFSGEISQIDDDGDHYAVEVKVQYGIYNVMVDKHTGSLVEIELVQEIEEKPPNDNNGSAEEENHQDQSNQPDDEQGEPNPEKPDQDTDENDKSETSVLPEEQVKEKVKNEIKGDITFSELIDEDDEPYYQMEVESDTELFKVEINAMTGKIEVVDVKERETPISQEEAEKIALKKLNGEIDDVERLEINGTIYYDIEMEAALNQDVTVRINALNGRSVLIWDDQNEEQDHDDK